MQRRALLGGLAVGSTAVLAGCSAVSLFESRVEETREQEFDPGGDAAVSVQSRNGDVDVETHDSDGVLVSATVTAPSDERLEDVTVEGGPSSDGAFEIAVDVGGDTSGVSVDLDVEVPEGTTMGSVESRNGDVSVRAVAGVGAATSQNGDVSVRETGPVRSVSSNNGDVEADVPAPLPGDVSVASENGDATVWLSPAVDAELVASSDNGDVEVTGLELADREDRGREVRGALGEGTNEVAVSSKNGDVTVEALD